MAAMHLNFLQCVNEKSDELPPHVEYISNRIVGKGININTDRSFLACCDCTDNCQVTSLTIGVWSNQSMSWFSQRVYWASAQLAAQP